MKLPEDVDKWLQVNPETKIIMIYRDENNEKYVVGLHEDLTTVNASSEDLEEAILKALDKQSCWRSGAI